MPMLTIMLMLVLVLVLTRGQALLKAKELPRPQWSST